MNKFWSKLLLGSGWLILMGFLVFGYMVNRLSPKDSLADQSAVIWPEIQNLYNGMVACLLTDEDLIERKEYLRSTIFPKVLRNDKKSNSMTYYFEDHESTLSELMEFVRSEKECCPFFKFDLSILPSNQGLALRISGSELAMQFWEEEIG